MTDQQSVRLADLPTNHNQQMDKMFHREVTVLPTYRPTNQQMDKMFQREAAVPVKFENSIRSMPLILPLIIKIIRIKIKIK